MMRVVTIVAAVVAIVLLRGGAKGDLPPPEASFKVLMLLPMSSKSHRNVFVAVAKALSDRGHKIVMLTNYPETSENPNIYEFGIELTKKRDSAGSMLKHSKGLSQGSGKFVRVLPQVAREIYKVPEIRKLYERRKQFDVIIVDHMFNELTYPFLHEMPFMTLTTNGLDSTQSAVVGNPLNTAYVIRSQVIYQGVMSHWQRFTNTLSLWAPIYWRVWAVVPLVQKEISAQFPSLPPLLEIERNQSVALINSHFSISQTVPLLPSQIEIGTIHCHPAKQLSQALASWISGAGPVGVIYFSLGSIASGESMLVHHREAFVEAFRRLPHRVLWKYEGDIEGLSKNVMIQEWFPQQDILGQAQVVLFISHGGLLGIQEAIYHTTPLLVLPIYGDQGKNAALVKMKGIGVELSWEELSAEAIVRAINKVTTNSKYKKNIKGMSKILQDQLTTPQEQAVFWTEYVIRHQGAPQLRSPAAQLSWVQFLMLDILVFLAVGLFIASYVLYQIIRFIAVKLFGSKVNKKKAD